MRLFLRSEVFQVGVLPHDLLNLKDVDISGLVAKLLVQQKATTFLKYSSWLRYAQILFNCSEHTARLYFETFLMVHRTTYKKKGAAKPMLSVDCGEFLVFLFLQKYRADQNGVSEAKSAETRHFEFFSKNIRVILSLLRDPIKQITTPLADTKTDPANSSSAVSNPPNRHGQVFIGRHEFTRLTFLVLAAAGPKAATELDSFIALAPFWASKPNTLVPLDTLAQ